jgi:uncharacterized membrane protein YjgN (DUF898 family)
MSDSLPSPFDLPPAPPPPAQAGTARLEFSGRRGDFVRLVSRGAFLELLTVGFYRFWLATDMRRHLWSNTSVNGDAAEYTGTAKELLIGFLFALAILAPLYLVYFLLGIEAETWQAFASVPLGLFFYVFAQFAMYRARRYRLTRTIWRGLRFWMTGSGWAYAWRASLWGLWVLLTLGLALPWQKAALERYKMKHTAYGDLKGEFVATGGQLFRKGWWLWLLAWPSVVLVIPLPFIYAAFKAIEWRWWASGLRMGDVHLTSDMPRGALIGLYWKIIGWSALLFTALGLYAGGILAMAFASTDASLTTEIRMVMSMQQIPVLVALGIGYLLTVLAFGAVTRIYLMRDVWARVAQSITVHNLATAENVAARGEADNALGEGFADSLDVVGI